MSLMNLNNTIVCFLFCFSLFAQADKPADLLNEAEKMLKQQNNTDAIQLFEELVAQGYVNQQVYYNLGTVYASESEPAKAVLYLRKALKLSPMDAKAKANLALARGSVKAQVIDIPEFFLLRYWKSMSNVFSSGSWAILGLVLLILSVFAFYRWLFGTVVSKKKQAFYGLIICLGLFFLSIASGWSKHRMETSTNQLVVMESIPMFEGPDNRSGELQTLSPGIECVVLDEISNYLKVKLRDHEIGWITNEKIRRI